MQDRGLRVFCRAMSHAQWDFASGSAAHSHHCAWVCHIGTMLCSGAADSTGSKTPQRWYILGWYAKTAWLSRVLQAAQSHGMV